MFCALTEFNPRISAVLLIYRFALWKTEETAISPVIGCHSYNRRLGNTCFVVHLTFHMNNFDLFLIQAVLSAD
jgi:hypothetical protein